MLFVILFYIIFWLKGLFMGTGNLAYYSFINKVIPLTYGEIFVGEALLTALRDIGFPVGWSHFEWKWIWSTAVWISLPTCFCTGYAFIHLLVAPMSQNYQNGAEENQRNAYGFKLKEILKRDKNIIRFIVASTYYLSGSFLFPFQTVYAKSNFNIGADVISVMNTIMFVCNAIGFILWGMLVQRRGFKWGMLGGYILFIVNLISAIFVNNPNVVMVLTVVYGLTHSAYMIGNINIVFGMCSYEDRPAYLCITNMFIIPISAIAPLINGYIYDTFGFKVMCVINLILLLGGIAGFWGVKEHHR